MISKEHSQISEVGRARELEGAHQTRKSGAQSIALLCEPDRDRLPKSGRSKETRPCRRYQKPDALGSLSGSRRPITQSTTLLVRPLDHDRLPESGRLKYARP